MILVWKSSLSQVMTIQHWMKTLSVLQVPMTIITHVQMRLLLHEMGHNVVVSLSLPVFGLFACQPETGGSEVETGRGHGRVDTFWLDRVDDTMRMPVLIPKKKKKKEAN